MWPFLLVPPSIVLHEVSHLLVAMAVGVPEPALHYAAISHGDISQLPGWAFAATSAAGPLLTVALSVFACFAIAQSAGSRWTFGLAAAASSRLLLGLPFAVLGTLSALLGNEAHSKFDEFQAAAAVGLPGLPFVIMTAACGLATFIFVGLRIGRAERTAAWPGIILGTVLGWAFWIFGLGPIILP